ncbi:MAG: phosphotransferase [Steroidobacteraceae bacterium]
MPDDPRLAQLRLWLHSQRGFDPDSIEVVSADASFRRYFRARRDDGQWWVAMDAPPDKEDLATYLRVSALLEGCGVHVPQILAADTIQGYALLEDLGNRHMLTALGEGDSAQLLYGLALDELARLQLAGDEASHALPPYDRATLLREMQLLPDWYCVHHLGFEPDAGERDLLARTFDWLAAEALRQPLVLVHRDYHSRNLMVTTERPPGVIDFQDALRGPVGYDPASILKDCYIDWPRAQFERWVQDYRARLLAAGPAGAQLAGSSPAEFLRWVDLIGLQRHLKVLGIFARLYWRDGKTGYLGDLPRTLAYVREAARLLPELAGFSRFVEERLVPGLRAANQRALAHAAARARG